MYCIVKVRMSYLLSTAYLSLKKTGGPFLEKYSNNFAKVTKQNYNSIQSQTMEAGAEYSYIRV